ncbi:hypothetical protein [Dictyobacter formicarum]|uniref:DUF5655 domain-containing protein n=2 Tax=Dictyobacter formicarum TaxID=2778368 RepID=A0ABQ3VGM3_9CHLR|nr:hypothetical protein [Dictyobacter formicarum]GHO84513.1 hypothetical protein KSZ_25190 [Dictyobacter formicarum]
MSTSHEYQDLSSEIHDDVLDEQEREAQRLSVRENAKHVLRESGLAEMLQSINRNLLKGRGHFEEYDSLVLFRWGTHSTRRHMWIEVRGSSILFRLHPHRKCAPAAPVCDGEYHTLTSAMWSDREFLKAELKKYYDRPVAETSVD